MSSRASSSQGGNRPSSAQGRPASSLGGSIYSTSSVPPKTPKVPASRFGGLSEKEVQKVSNMEIVCLFIVVLSLASRSRLLSPPLASRPTVARLAVQNRSTSRIEVYSTTSLISLQRAQILSSPVVSAPAGSFLAEASFVNAPLSSRLPPTSPRRTTLKTTSTSSSSRHQQTDTEAVSNDRIARVFANGTAAIEEGVEEDSASEDEEESVEVQKERRVREGMDRESLKGLGTDIQEALIVEDLLFVLMVCNFFLETLPSAHYATTGYRRTVHRV